MGKLSDILWKQQERRVFFKVRKKISGSIYLDLYNDLLIPLDDLNYEEYGSIIISECRRELS